jgi:hypothetical protein
MVPQSSLYKMQIGTKSLFYFLEGLNLKIHDFVGDKNKFNPKII